EWGALAWQQRPVDGGAPTDGRDVSVGLEHIAERVIVQIVEQVPGDRGARVEATQPAKIFQRCPELVEFRTELVAQLLARAVGVLPDLAHGTSQPGHRGGQPFRAQDEQPSDEEDQELPPADVEHPYAPLCWPAHVASSSLATYVRSV